jgi:hypothetical protein
MMDQRQKVLIIAKAIQAVFSSSEWTEIGYLTSTDDWIDRHPRLLRSLYWRDDDYKGHVIDAVAHILYKNPDNIKILMDYDPIGRWLFTNNPAEYEELRSEVLGLEVAEVVPSVSTEAGLAALADAQTLLRTRGPTSAVDRVHTGFHAFLRGACSQAGIEFTLESTPNNLLRKLLDEHPALSNLGPRTQEIKRMIRSGGAIVDAMGTLRNRASLAHANEELIGQDEALLTINLSRSLLRFLDAKIGKGN